MEPSTILGANGQPVTIEQPPAPSAGATADPPIVPAPIAPALPAVPPVANDDTALYSKNDLSRIVQERLTRDRVDRKGKKTEATQPELVASEESAILRAELDEMKTLRTFDQAVTAIPLDAVKRNALQTLFLAAKPESPTEWATEQAQSFGWIKQETPTPPTTTPPTTPPTAPQPNPPGTVPVTHGAAPAADPTSFTDADDPLQWKGDVLARIRSEKGQKYITKRFQEAMAGRHIVLKKG